MYSHYSSPGSGGWKNCWNLRCDALSSSANVSVQLILDLISSVGVIVCSIKRMKQVLYPNFRICLVTWILPRSNFNYLIEEYNRVIEYIGSTPSRKRKNNLLNYCLNFVVTTFITLLYKLKSVRVFCNCNYYRLIVSARSGANEK